MDPLYSSDFALRTAFKPDRNRLDWYRLIHDQDDVPAAINQKSSFWSGRLATENRFLVDGEASHVGTLEPRVR
ncbi:hypothetical protein Poly21_32750 [Allorhodopirellula heiligendammensis]|uniref:Uncharacterized protein n=1 Tax=Allorhodopirellula heiligendammensis TaxID=2714739 RepID=A0A5C6BUW8_9BACT|nr:hypothetical protein Poly21_32750 [Allorhodopirellula heiligendammensis]